jgi:HSP20 family molecular chaperone IbpA
MKMLELEVDEILKMANSGKLEGTWETREINEPGVKGFIIRGRFGTDNAQEPLEPLKPSKRRPLPENPFELPKRALNETREPLTDVFEEEKAIKIYVELPGEEKDDIKLNVKEGNAEIKAKNFYKVIELPNKPIDSKAVSSEYKNGVLKVTIPKKEESYEKCKGKTRLV